MNAFTIASFWPRFRRKVTLPPTRIVSINFRTDSGLYSYCIRSFSRRYLIQGPRGDSADISRTLFLDEPDNYVTLPDVVFQMSTPLTRNVLELFVFHSTTISRRQRPPRRRVPIPVEARVQMTAVTRYPVATAAGAPAGS